MAGESTADSGRWKVRHKVWLNQLKERKGFIAAWLLEYPDPEKCPADERMLMGGSC